MENVIICIIKILRKVGKHVKRARKKLFSAGKNRRDTRSITTKSEQEKTSVFDDININEDDKKNLQIKYFGKIFDEDFKDEKPQNTTIISSGENEQADILKESAQIEEFAEDITPEQELPQDDKVEETCENDDGQSAVPNENTEDTQEQPTVTPDENLEDTKDLSDIILPVQENINEEKEPSHEKFERQAPGKKKKFALIFSISLAVILLASIFAVCMSGLFDRSGNEFEQDYIEPVDISMGRVNVLILGVDKDKLRTDTIIIASLDTDNGKIDFLSIPRDTRMYIGSKFQKINSAHALSQ